jgi:uncharacterized membrane-anchored protein YhcB (DUF1043 family)
MTNLLIGIIIGLALSAVGSSAFDVQKEQERQLQQQERFEQQFYRLQQPPFTPAPQKPPC